MKALYLLSAIFIALFLQGCTSVNKVQPNGIVQSDTTVQPPRCHHHKDPLKVSFVGSHKNLHTPYQVIGTAAVSQFNSVGVKRQEATIHDIMRELAASLDGDAVINMDKNGNVVKGTVISFKNKRVMV
jgi:hypothetical protein